MSEPINSDLFSCIINEDLVGLSKVALHLLWKANAGDGGTSLHVAAEFDKIQSVKEICRRCPLLLEHKDNTGQTPLHIAAWHGYVEVVNTLVYNGTAKSRRLKMQDTESEELESENSIKNELQKKQDISKVHPPDTSLLKIVDKEGNMALHLAVERGNLEVVKLLTDAGPGIIYPKNHFQRTPLDIAIDNGSLRIMNQIIEACGLSASASDNVLDRAYDSWLQLGETGFLKVIYKIYPARIRRQRGSMNRTELHEAASDGRIEMVKFLVNAASEMNDKVLLGMLDINKDIALHCAVKNKHLEVVKLLVEDKKLLVMANGNNDTALHLAVQTRSIEIATLLVQADAERKLLKMVDKNRNTALHLAVEVGYFPMVEYLTNEYHNNEMMSIGGKNGNTAFHLAVINQQIEIVKHFLSKDETDKILVRVCNDDQETILHVAARSNFFDILEMLYVKGLDKETMSMVNKNKNTALHLAVEYKHFQIVKFFTEADEDLVRMANEKGNTVLHLAVLNRHLDIVKYFLSKVNPEKKWEINEDKETVLHLGVKIKDLEIVRCLIAANPSKRCIRMCNKDKDTALHLAVQNSHEEVVILLTSMDREYKYSTNKDRKTPLDMAIEKGSYSMVKQILDACVPSSYKGPNRKTALLLALECKHTGNETNSHSLPLQRYNVFHCQISSDIRKLLLGKLPDQCEVKGKFGWTALHYATSMQDLDAIEDILQFCPSCSPSVNEEGQNFLHLAASLKFNNVVKYVIELETINPTVLNTQDKAGDTPLHIAAETGEQSLVELLLYDKRVNKTIKNWKGEKALDTIKFNYDKKLAGVDVRDKVDENQLKNQSDFDLVVCALIATVSFTSGVVVPGGYTSASGKAILHKEKMFKAFVISNTFALMFSLSALFSHFLTKKIHNATDINFHKTLATCCTLLAISTMIVAFATGSYAVLSISEDLAISVCGISAVFFIFALYAISRIIYHEIREMAMLIKERTFNSGRGTSQHTEIPLVDIETQ